MENIHKKRLNQYVSADKTKVSEFINSSRSGSSISQFINRRGVSTPSVSKFISTKKDTTLLVNNFISGKVTIDKASDILSSPGLSDSVKSRLLTNKIIGSNSKSGIKNIFTKWISDNFRPIIWTVTWTVMASLAVTLAYILATSSSWSIFLGMLQYLGINIVPTAILDGLKMAGVSAISGITINSIIGLSKHNKKVKRLLETNVSEKYIAKTLKKLGVDVKTTKYEDITKKVFSHVTNIAWYVGTGNISGLFYSSGLNIGIRAGIKIKNFVMSPRSENKKLEIKKSILIKKSSETVNVAANLVLNDSGNKSIVKNMIDEVNSISPKIYKRKIDAQMPNITEVPKNFKVSMAENRSAVFAGATAVTIVGIALSGGTELGFQDIMDSQISQFGTTAMSKMGNLAISTFDMVKESELAKTTLTGILINKVGIGKVIDKFSDLLSPIQQKELKTLAQAIKFERNENKLSKNINNFLSIMSGEKRYSALAIKKINKHKLREIWKSFRPEDKRLMSYSDSQLRDFIIREQSERLKRINNMVSLAIHSSVRIVASNVIYKTATSGYSYVNAKLEDIKLLELELYEERIGMEERDKSILESEKTKELEKIHRRTEARKKISELKLESARYKSDRLKKHTIALEKLSKRVEIRRLKDSALAEHLARNMNIVITTKDGISHPLPPEEIILPEELQNALDWEFTPLGQYVAKETVKSISDFIPGVGWIQSAINKVNIGLTAGETIKDISKIGEILVRLELGESGAKIDPTLGKLDDILKMRLPSLTTLVEDVIKTDTLVAKEVVLQALKDKIVEGWDIKRTSYEIGKIFLGGTGEDVGIDITEAYGSELWKKAFG